jgi:hypothetical protein
MATTTVLEMSNLRPQFLDNLSPTKETEACTTTFNRGQTC